MIWGVLIGMAVGMLLGYLANRAAYRLGVCDGYEYAHDPSSPVGKDAAPIVKRMVAHRCKSPLIKSDDHDP